MQWFSRTVDFFKELFYNEYQLTVWFVEEEIFDAVGNLMSVKKITKVFYLTSIDKLTPKHIVGKEKDGGKIVIKTQKPFDYNLRKLH